MSGRLPRVGGPQVCDRVVAELEEQWSPERVAAYLDALGPPQDTETTP